jgi:fucokinase
VWDICVLTAANGEQAKSYQMQIDDRKKEGLLSEPTQYLVVADPQGRRIGSGGATMHALAVVRSYLKKENEKAFRNRRILILHSGGDSKRIPHYSAFGKIFSHVPRELSFNGRPSTLFDEFCILLSSLPSRMKEGVLVVSGDVFLIFNPSQLDFNKRGVIGFGIQVAREMGSHHGVYGLTEDTFRVQRFLHKVSPESLTQEGLVNQEGKVLVDSGMVWFDPEVANVLADLIDETEEGDQAEKRRFWLNEGVSINLYGDILFPLAKKNTLVEYLSQPREGKDPQSVQSAREKLWNLLRSFPLFAQVLEPAEFIHFGTTAEYRDLLLSGVDLFEDLGWKKDVQGYREGDGSKAVFINSYLGKDVATPYPCLIEDSLIEGSCVINQGCVISNIINEGFQFHLNEDLVLYQVPLNDGNFVTHIYGVFDNPKKPLENGTFCNHSWREWLAKARLTEYDLWGDKPQNLRSLWNARLFPAEENVKKSLEKIIWMQEPELAYEIKEIWRNSYRLSLEESAMQADKVRILCNQKSIEDKVRSSIFLRSVINRKPAKEAIPLLGEKDEEIVSRLKLTMNSTEKLKDPLQKMRGYRALSEVCRIHKINSPFTSNELENRAFSELNREINRTLAQVETMLRDDPPRFFHHHVWVRTAVRADLGGGWSDTPPFSIEHGGTVLNCALTLNGELPIQVEAQVLDRPVLVFKSEDLDFEREITCLSELTNYRDLNDPLTLHKAALLFTGFIRPDETRPLPEILKEQGGLSLSTRVAIPKGSGLGTSSILGGAMLICLKHLFGQTVDEQILFEEVLALEQRLTTGGGWQDQVGGLTPGIKLVFSQPGLPQYPTYTPVLLDSSTRETFENHYVLIYTGQKRLAKRILWDIMGEYILADSFVVQSLLGIKEIAREMLGVVTTGDIKTLGELMKCHWVINKQMDTDCTNPLIDRIFEVINPYIYGGKMCGAGGGGFMEVVVKDGCGGKVIEQVLRDEFHDGQVHVCPAKLAQEPLMMEIG